MKRILFLLLTYSSLVFGQSVRPSHWLSDYAAFEQARGYLWSLLPLTLPYESAALLRQINSELAGSGDATQPAYEKSLYMLQRLGKNPLQSGDLQIGMELEQSLEGSESSWPFRSRNRLSAAYRPRPWLLAASGVVMDSRLDEDPQYLGIRQNGVSAYAEYGYLRLHHRGFTLAAGRDYLRLGPGLDATLLLSDYSRPLDHVQLAFQTKRWRYSFIAAQLDPWTGAAEAVPSSMARYLALHRLEIRPASHFHLAVGEAILYGTTSAPHWAFLNPLLFFHGEQMNGPQTGNVLGSLQATWMPLHNLTIYGDLLIDDVQIEKQEAGDHEPDEYGFTAGLRWADPLRWRGTEFYAEYCRISNRTYNGQGGEWEKWLHRRMPLGHFLGNDFDRLLTGIQIWPESAWRLQLQFEHRRCGEGRIDKPFDTPWMDQPESEDYSEPFPTGIVESSDRLLCGLDWQPVWWAKVFVRMQHISVQNENNARGIRDAYWQIHAGLAVEWLFKLAIGD
jgi:hypothetical protein